MNRAIVIIHSSELLRKALSGVLENKFTTPIVCFSKAEEYDKARFWGVEEIVFIVDRAFSDLKNVFSTSTKSNLFIGISLDQEEKNEILVDYVFSIFESMETLIHQIEQFFSEHENTETDELSNREKEVLRLIAMGHTNKSIAEKLFISAHTVISHRKNITEKLGIKSIPGLTVYAIIQNIVNTSEIASDQLR